MVKLGFFKILAFLFQLLFFQKSSYFLGHGFLKRGPREGHDGHVSYLIILWFNMVWVLYFHPLFHALGVHG